jgi:hypothetical protein
VWKTAVAVWETISEETIVNATIEDDKGISPPKKGDQFQCSSCGMAIQVTKDCNCKEDEHVHFHCCGREMESVR